MVEDESVKRAMQDVSAQLQEMMKDNNEYGVGVDDFTELQQRASSLASALRASIASSWDVKLADASAISSTVVAEEISHGEGNSEL